MNPPVGIQGQMAGEAVELQVGGAGIAAQRGGEPVRVKAKGKEAAEPRTAAVGPCIMHDAANGVRELSAQYPGHVGEHQSLELLVVARVWLERIGRRVSGDVAGEMESKLGAQQALDVGRCRREDEFQVTAAARLELWLGSENRLEPSMPRVAVVDAQYTRDGIRVIRQRGLDGRRSKQVAAAGLQLLAECVQHARAPVARRHDGNTVAAP